MLLFADTWTVGTLSAFSPHLAPVVETGLLGRDGDAGWGGYAQRVGSDQWGRDAVEQKADVVARAVQALREVLAAVDAGELACPVALRNHLPLIIVALRSLGSE